jgi:ATP-dependent DNA helicase RecQ
MRFLELSQPFDTVRPMLPDVSRALDQVFGFQSLRPGQAEVIDDVLAGRPVVTVMPTGAGKSLCYQLPAVLLGEQGGVTLVVSPLIALMKDQVDSLRALGVAAAALTSAASPEEQAEILAGIRAGLYTLVYVAPERFRSPRFASALAEAGDRLVLLAIDEAHCISEWGHEFRPDYRRLGEVVGRIRPPRLIALTATATPEVRTDIATQLGLEAPSMHVRGFDRPNLRYAVTPAGGTADKSQRLVELVRTRTGGVALVYAATRKNAERYAAALGEVGMRVRVYHAGLDDTDRHQAQDEFMAGTLDVIVATNAFGMGVDKSDIRLVVHADLPRSPEAYYQEAGRGGRDGRSTDCVLLFNHADVRLQEFLIDASYPGPELMRALWKEVRDHPEQGADVERLRRTVPGEPTAAAVKSGLRILERHGFLRAEGPYLVAARPHEAEGYAPLDLDGLARRAEVERSKLRSMVEYAYHPACRRQFILRYFGDVDWAGGAQRCTGCDNCTGQGHSKPLTDEQIFQVRALLALIDRLRGRFGRTRVAALATGSDDDDRFIDLPERGTLRGQSARQVMDLLRALEGAGLIEASRGEYPTLAITAAGREVAEGTTDAGELSVFVPAPRKSRKRAAAPVVVSDEPIDGDLVERLRQLRTDLARETSVPPYVVFSNRTLEALARARPSSTEELLAVPGIGQNKLDRYGDAILATMREA